MDKLNTPLVRNLLKSNIKLKLLLQKLLLHQKFFIVIKYNKLSYPLRKLPFFQKIYTLNLNLF